MRETAIAIEKDRQFRVKAGQKLIRGSFFPTTSGQRSSVQHRTEWFGRRL